MDSSRSFSNTHNFSFQAVGWDIRKFKNIQRWVEDCVSLPGYQENQDGAKLFGAMVKKNLKQ